MEKIKVYGAVILFFASVVLLNAAALEKKPITAGDLPALKGKWEGTRLAGTMAVANTDLFIENDTLPLRGVLKAYNVMVRGSQGRTVTLEFKNGQIDNQGNLVIKKDQNEFEFSLYGGEGKMKLEGNYYFMGARGKITLYKK